MAEERKSDILSHAEIKELLERNNMHPELGRPVYVAWSDNKGKCHTQFHLDQYLKASNVDAREEPLHRWGQRLDSKTFRVSHKGQKDAKTVMRPVKTRDGWVEVALNG